MTHRLATAVIEGKPSNVAREAELIGRMKEIDLFVRNAEPSVDIFLALAESSPSNELQAIDKYKD